MTLSELLSDLRYRIRALVKPDAMNRELNEELRFHLERETEKYVAQGMSRASAVRAARLAFGGVDDAAESSRDARGVSMLDSLGQDVRFALRTMRRRPGFTVVALAVLALGIGGTTAILGLADTVLARAVPGVSSPDRLVSFLRSQPGGAYNSFSYPDYLDLRARAHSFSSLAAYVGTPVTVLGTDGRARRARAQLVSGNYFSTLRVSSQLGRLIDESDDRDASHVVVLSYDYWRHELGGDPAVVGKTIRAAGQPFTVVGVAAREFTGPEVGQVFELWTPLSTQPILLSRMSAGVMRDRSAGWLSLVARLASGVEFDRAAAEVRMIGQQLAAAFPSTNGDRVITARAGIGLDDEDRGPLEQTFGLLSVAVLLVLMIACANVAGLSLVAGLDRHREIAARVAIGATRRRVVRQLIVEGVVLGVGAAILGLALAAVLDELIPGLQPEGSVLHAISPDLDGRMIAIAGLATVVSSALFGILPALKGSIVDLAAVLRGGSTGSSGHRRAQRVLIESQVAVAFALLVTASIITRSINRLLTRPPGFDIDGIVMVSVDLSAEGFGEQRGLEVYRRLITNLSNDPAIRSASFGKTVPPRDWSDRVSVFAVGQVPSRQELRDRGLSIGYRVRADGIAPNYFRTMGIRLLAGRDFTQADDAAGLGVIIVNQAFARDYFGTSNPIGRRIAWPTWNGPDRAPVEVVGVVADHQYTTLIGAPEPLMYYPVLQRYDGRTTIVARTAGDDDVTLAALARAVHNADPNIAAFGAMTMPARMAGTVWQQRMLAAWLTLFGALGLLMSVVGLYAVVARSVAQRTRELSLRMALGASPLSVRRGVIVEGLWMTSIGMLAGVPLAIGGSRIVDLERPDGSLWLLCAATIIAATLIATYLPARRASRLNPADALRAS